MSRSLKLTKAQCEAWVANPTVNPKTGKSINVDGPTYTMIKTHCITHGIQLDQPNEPGQPGPSNHVPKAENTEKMPKV